MKRSANKLYKPGFGIVFALLAVTLVLACGGAELDNLKLTDPKICSEGDAYNPNHYSYIAEEIKSEIIEDQLIDKGVYVPYLNSYYDESEVRLPNNTNATIDHIVARRNAHKSGLCNESVKVRREFASDLLNITLAPRDLNSRKGSDTADGWKPNNNECWFVYTIVQVKDKYDLTVTPAERSALNRIWNSCNGDFRLEKDR